ncbi:CBS domain protein [Dictyocaulus viviparus]|uniref:CBS domain protein n=1 Tax=Dictyocaulus viviparus TaxID=29172 RepID=A0A0D8X8U0_DICVI|nr:CBS domain protein [Dictyocaulus viviparus]
MEEAFEYFVRKETIMAASKTMGHLMLNNNRNGYRAIPQDAMAKLLQSSTCFDALPLSQNVLILDEDLLMWEGFRRILASELVARAKKRKTLVWLSAEDSLLEAVRMLAKYQVHRIPIFNPLSFDPIGIVTYKCILKFLWRYGNELFQQNIFTKTPKELCIGTWKGIRVVFPETPLTDCFDILLNLRISAVPVVEPITLRVVDMYSRFDAVNIALQNEGFKIRKNVRQALECKYLCATVVCCCHSSNEDVVDLLHILIEEEFGCDIALFRLSEMFRAHISLKQVGLT